MFAGSDKSLFTKCDKVAVQLYQNAITAAEHLKITDKNYEKLFICHIELIHGFTRLGLFEEQDVPLNKAMELALNNHNLFWQSVVNLFYCNQALTIKTTTIALGYAEKNVILAKQSDSRDILLMNQLTYIHVYAFSGQYTKLNQIINELLNTTPDLNYYPYLVKISFGFLALFYLTLGCIHSGNYSNIESKKELIVSSTNLMQPDVSSDFANATLGICYFYKGHFTEANDYLVRSFQYAKKLEIMSLLPLTAAALGCNALYLHQNKEGTISTMLLMSLNLLILLLLLFLEVDSWLKVYCCWESMRKQRNLQMQFYA